jgi:hypothetical protein
MSRQWKLEDSMQRYEIRVLKDSGSLSLKMASDYLNSNAAIAAARRLSKGKPFEVWRGDYCVYAHDRRDSFIPPNHAAQLPLERRQAP